MYDIFRLSILPNSQKFSVNKVPRETVYYLIMVQTTVEYM